MCICIWSVFGLYLVCKKTSFETWFFCLLSSSLQSSSLAAPHLVLLTDPQETRALCVLNWLPVPEVVITLPSPTPLLPSMIPSLIISFAPSGFAPLRPPPLLSKTFCETPCEPPSPPYALPEVSGVLSFGLARRGEPLQSFGPSDTRGSDGALRDCLSIFPR